MTKFHRLFWSLNRETFFKNRETLTQERGSFIRGNFDHCSVRSLNREKLTRERT